MDIREFIKEYGITKEQFCTMAHIGTRTLTMYERGEKVNEKSLAKIENVVYVMRKYNYKKEPYDYSKAFGFFGRFYKEKYHENVREYMQKFEELMRAEGF